MSTSPFSPPLTLPLNAFNLSSSLSDTQNNSTKSNISFFPAENLRKKEMEIDGVKPIIENRNIFRALSKNVRSTYSTRRRVGSIFRDVPDNIINNIRLTKNDSIRDLDFGGDLIANYNNYVSSMTNDNNDDNNGDNNINDNNNNNMNDNNNDYEDTNTEDINDVSVMSNSLQDVVQGYKYRKLQRNFDKYLTRNDVEELNERGSFRMVQKANKNTLNKTNTNNNTNRNSHNFSNNNIIGNNNNNIMNNNTTNNNNSSNDSNNDTKTARFSFKFNKNNSNNTNNIDNKKNESRTKSQRFSTINEEEPMRKKEMGSLTTIVEKNKKMSEKRNNGENNKNEKIMKMNIEDQKNLFSTFTAQHFISTKFNAINKFTKQYSDAAMNTIKNILFEPENSEK